MSFGKEVRKIILRGYYEHKVIKITLEKWPHPLLIQKYRGIQIWNQNNSDACLWYWETFLRISIFIIKTITVVNKNDIDTTLAGL